MGARAATFSLSETPLEALPRWKPSAKEGAVVSFWGYVREINAGRTVTGLEYTVYPELALKEGRRIVKEALNRFGVAFVRAAHRVGFLKVGDAAIVVEVASGHRGEGFAACRWVVDEIKARVPIWKQEHYLEGEALWLEGTPPEV